MNRVGLGVKKREVAAVWPAPLRHASGTVHLLRRSPVAVIGAGLILAAALLAVAAGVIAPHNPVAQIAQPLLPPGRAYLAGTDELGRDEMSRLIYGARVSLYVGVLSVSIALALGASSGVVAGFYGGWLDNALMRAMDVLFSLPAIVLAIAITSILGPSLTNAMIAIGIAATPLFIRLTRGQVLAVKTEDFVEAARAVGNPHRRILLRHILPNVVSPLIVQATLTIATAIIAEASLSFLGLGQQPPDPSWGSMLNFAKNFISQAPWMAVWPGLAICTIVLAFNLLGDGLRDVLDPRA